VEPRIHINKNTLLQTIHDLFVEWNCFEEKSMTPNQLCILSWAFASIIGTEVEKAAHREEKLERDILEEDFVEPEQTWSLNFVKVKKESSC
jgi:hypothetical protein